MTKGALLALGTAIGRLLVLVLDRYDQPNPVEAMNMLIRELEAEARIKHEARRAHAQRRAGK